VYLAPTNANTLYVFAETIASRSMMNAIDPEDHAEAFANLIRETSRIYGYFSEVASAIMLACFERHLGGSLYELGANVVKLEGTPNWRSIDLPYFVDFREARPRGPAGSCGP
jgi:hypothetical protein